MTSTASRILPSVSYVNFDIVKLRFQVQLAELLDRLLPALDRAAPVDECC